MSLSEDIFRQRASVLDVSSASIASALINLPLVHDRRTTWTLAIISAALVTLGLLVLALRRRL